MMSTDLGAHINALCLKGDNGSAAALLFQHASWGDAEALFLLAMWRISGALIKRDLTKARDLLRIAAEGGHNRAMELYAVLLANGTGGPPNWKRAVKILEESVKNSWSQGQLALLAQMELDVEGNPTSKYEMHKLSNAPEAYICEHFLSPAECVYLTNHAKSRLKPALVVDPASGRFIPHPIRRSDAAMFGVLDEDLVVHAINRRIAAFSGTAVTQGETLQVLRYGPGGEYKPHLDAVPGTDNQRIITVLIYLNEDYTGGETAFATGVSFQGRTGSALLFRNVLADGRPDPESQHAGCPVLSGQKFIASRWIRRMPFSFPAPQPVLAGFE